MTVREFSPALLRRLSGRTPWKIWPLTIILPALLVLPVPLAARGDDSNGKSYLQPLSPQVNYAKRALQGFNMRYWLSNQMTLGLESWDCASGDCIPQDPGYGLEYPNGSGIDHLFGAGPWIGAIVDGTRRVSEGYNGDNANKYLRPDPRHPLRELIWRTSLGDSLTEPNRRGEDDDSDGQIDEDDLDGLDNDGDWVLATDDIGSDGISDSMEVGCMGGYDALTNPDPYFDNYEPTKTDFCHPDANGNYRRQDDPDLYTEKNGVPDHGEPDVDEDYGAMSDNDLYCTARDDNDVPAGHFPMGVRVTQKSYSWKAGTSADAVSILEYTFQNVGTRTMEDVYAGYFVDADVGPVNTGSYASRNYSCYIDSVRTAYVHNPIDRGSTPIGLTVLGTSRPLDDLKYIYQWFNFTTNPGPGTTDSVLYGWMSGEPFPDNLIAACESPTNPSDTRFLFSFGPFDSASPGSGVKVAFALVAGESIDEMAMNAGRAIRIYAAGGFISPVLRIEDASQGTLTLGWTTAQSPYGHVTSYRLFYGTSPGVYTDSIETTGLSSEISGLHDSLIYYFAVLGIDDRGNRGALSEEISTVPQAPRGLVVTGEQRSMHLRWNKNISPVTVDYNVYRRTDQETLMVRLNAVSISDTFFVDSTAPGSSICRYRITAVNGSGFESPFSIEDYGWLIPPSVPARFVIGPGVDFVRLEWDENQEDDFAGYNVYRTGPDTTRLNSGLLPEAGYTDTTIETTASYGYFIEAVDSTGASARTSSLGGHIVIPDRGILAIVDVCDSVPRDSAAAFAQALLAGYQDSITFVFPVVYYSSPMNTLSPFSSVIWISDCQQPRGYQYPLALRGYVAGGGHLLIIGPGITTKSYPSTYQFLADLFGVDPFLGISATADFAGASGSNGFPSVAVDSAKLAYLGGRANLVETFDNIPPERVLYSYLSDPVDSTREGKAVGIRALRDDRNAYYFSFPLYSLDSSDASAMIRRVLTDFGEVLVDVAVGGTELPTRFHLYDAYPNPFNPSTTIRFDVPVHSHIRLSLYDVLGRELDPLFDGDLPPGRHEVRWDASGMASGMYYVRMRADGGTVGDVASPELRKLLLLK